MNEINVNPQLVDANLTAEEGSKNIDKSRVVQTAPDMFIDDKSMDEAYHSKISDKGATPTVAKKLSESRSMASVVKDDLDVWNTIEKGFSSVGDAIKGVLPDFVQVQNKQREANQLYYKKATGEATREEITKSRLLQMDIDDYHAKNPTSTGGEIGQTVAGSLLDIGRSVIDNPKAALVPAGVGAGFGLPGGLVGVAAGATTGFLTVGLPAAQAEDAYTQTYGQIFNDLTEGKNEKGVPYNIPVGTAKELSQGAGMLAGAINAIDVIGVMRQTPAIKSLTSKVIQAAARKGATTIITDASMNAAERTAFDMVKKLGKIAAIGGTAGSMQTFVQQVVQKSATAFPDKNNKDILGSMAGLVNDYYNEVTGKQNTGKLKQVATAGVGGALGGIAAAGAFQAVGKTIKGAGKALGGNQPQSGEPAPTPGFQGPDSGGGSSIEGQSMKLPGDQRFSMAEQNLRNKIEKFQLPAPGESAVKGTTGLEAKIILDELNKQISSTKLDQLQPGESSKFKAEIAAKNGVPFSWVNPDELRTFADNAAKAEDVRAILGGDAEKNARMDAQVKINTGLALDFVKKYPEASAMFNFTPEGKSANAMIAQAETLKAKQSEILGSTREALSPDQVMADPNDEAQISFSEQYDAKKADDAKKINLGPQSTQQDIAAAFPFREDAQAYIERLNQEIEATPDNASLEEMNGVLSKLRMRDTVKAALDGLPVQKPLNVGDFGGIQQWLEKNAPEEKATLKDGSEITLSARVQTTGDGVTFPQIVAKDSTGKEVGVVSIAGQGTADGGFEPTSADTNVTKEDQRKGIATAMYDYATKHVADLKPSLIQTPEGKAFTESYFRNIKSQLDEVSDHAIDLATGSDRVGDAQANADLFPPEVRKAIAKYDANRIESAYKEASQQYADSINDAASQEMNKVIDQHYAIALEVERDIVAENLRNHAEIDVVEKFLNSRELTPADRAAFGGSKKKTFPGFSIDPESLSPMQRGLYLDDPQMAARKVFSKDGMTVQDVAGLLGVENSDQLLKILKEVPTREEAITQGVKAKESEIIERAKNSVDLNEAAITKALENKSEANRQALEVYRNEEWTGYKKAIRRVALDMPVVRDVRAKAESDINQTKISDLNVQQFKVGERRSKSKAVEALTRGDLPAAFDAKKNEIYNIEYQRATHKAIGKVNRRVQRIAKFFTSEVRNELEAAGPQYIDAVKQVMQAFNLSPYQGAGNEAKQDAYINLAEEMAVRGQGDIAMPEHILADYDPRMSWDAMTVEQYAEITDLLENTLKLARKENEFYQNQKMQYVSLMESAVQLNLADHPDYDSSRSEKQINKSISDVAYDKWTGAESAFSNMAFTVQFLDRGDANGFFHKMIMDKLNGVGEFDTGIEGVKGRDNLLGEIRKSFSKAIKAYGPTKFINMGVEKVKVPAFEGIRALNNGNLRKSDLFVMATYMGNEGNIERMSNYGLTKEQMLEGLRQGGITAKEMQVVQDGIWNTYRGLEDRIVALEKQDYEDVQLVKPVPFEFDGKTFEGGYSPIQYSVSALEEGQKLQSIKDQFEKEANGYPANWAARAATERGYTEKRTGSDQLPTLNMGSIAVGFQEVANDLAMRNPVRDVAKMLSNKTIKKEIINVIGRDKFKMMIDGLASQTITDDARRYNAMIQSESMMDRFFSRVENAEAIQSIALNLSSVLMQPLSLGVAVENMGGTVQGGNAMARALGTMAMPWNWKYYPEFKQLAMKIDPSLARHDSNIDDHVVGGVMDTLPTRNVLPSKTLNMAGLALRKANNGAMSILGFVDSMTKTIVSVSAYQQYMRGEAPFQNVENFWKKSVADQRTEAEAYAHSINEKSTTRSDDLNKANIQRTALGKRFAKFFNDVRSQLNTSLMSGRKIKWDYTDAINNAKNGDFVGASRSFSGVVDQTISLAVLAGIMGFYEAMFRGNVKDDDGDIDPGKLAWSVIRAKTIGASPILRDIDFAAQTNQAVSIPFIRAMTNVAQSIGGAGVLLNNYTGLIDDQNMEQELNDKQIKGMLSTTGYLLGGVPLNGPFKFVKAANDETDNMTPEKVVLGAAGLLIDKMKSFIDKFSNTKDPELMKVVEQVKIDHAQLEAVQTQREDFKVSELTLKAFKFAESNNGDWNTTNASTGAFSPYQFLPSTWRDVVNRAPKSLGLTVNGLYQKSGKQVEKGIRWFIEDNARQLQNANVEPTDENLYGAHHFGARTWIKIHDAKDTTPKSKLVSAAAIEANGWLSDPSVKNAADIKQWIYDYIDSNKTRALEDL